MHGMHGMVTRWYSSLLWLSVTEIWKFGLGMALMYESNPRVPMPPLATPRVFDFSKQNWSNAPLLNSTEWSNACPLSDKNSLILPTVRQNNAPKILDKCRNVQVEWLVIHRIIIEYLSRSEKWR